MYTNLIVKSDYSFTEGASKIKDLLSKAKEEGHSALAITDRNNMFGAYEFSKFAKSLGIKPLIGCQMPITYDKKNNKVGYITLFAQNEQGYKNICHIMCESQKPDSQKADQYTINMQTLMDNAGSVIAVSGGYDGVLYRMLEEGQLENAHQLVVFLHKVFKDRLYLQINRNRKITSTDKKVEEAILKIASSQQFKIKQSDGTVINGIPVVATSEVRYTSSDRHDSYEILRAIDENRKISIDNEKIIRNDDNDYSFKSNDEFEKIFSDIPNSILNANYLAQRCSFIVEDREPILPAFETEAGRTELEELRTQSFDGLEVRIQGMNLSEVEIQKYKDRLDYELNIIANMGFPGYFLIVSDFIKWAKENDIPVGPGRGSGAGSMVAYCLMITNLDPFRFGLLFERFLNPERVSMPDFDVDFCQDRREEVIQYVQRKYGVDKVSQIATFGEIKSKTAIKDTGRVIIHESLGGYGFGETNEFTKMIPKKENSQEPKNLQEAFDTTPDLNEKIQKSEKLKILFENSLKIEGLYRSSGAHAAGVIIGDRTLHELVPLKWDDNTGMPLSQFNMKGSENVGLVKFDFLGLKTLSVIKEAVDLIKEKKGIAIDIDEIDLAEEGVFKMLQEGRSNGVFQFESAGMQNVLRQVKPTRIEDLIAVNALYRPGPMDQIEHYANCKNGYSQPRYPNPIERTKPFLEETYGIMIYQEQVMRVAQEVAGYSLGAADLLRRAMGKKIQSEMDAQKSMFIEGAVERGTTEKEADQLFETIAKFAGYGFNKSHAAAYAYIAYQTAWLKKNYPAEFFAALLSYEQKPERMALIKEDMDDFGIRMLPPDINQSFPSFKTESDKKSYQGFGIRFGLNAIKGLSGDMAGFIEERQKAEFKDLRDFAKRGGAYFNKAKFEKMAESGVFDSLYENRYGAVSIIKWHMQNQKTAIENQDSLFGEELDSKVPDELLELEDWGDKTEREFNAVGFYFHNHPIDTYLPRLKKAKIKRLSSLREYMVDTGKAELSFKKVCVMVENCFPKNSRNDKLYLTARVAEKGESFDIPFFGSKKMKVEEALNILNSAKANRVPVVANVNLVLEERGTSLRVYAQEFFEIEQFLSEVRGDVILIIDTDKMISRTEEYRLELEAKKEYANNEISESEFENRKQKIFIQKVSSRMTELKSYLASIQVDQSKSAIGMQIILKSGDNVLESKKLDGKYLFTPVSENHLKTMDGIISVQEEAIE